MLYADRKQSNVEMSAESVESYVKDKRKVNDPRSE